MKFSAINLLNTTATNSTIHFLQAQTCFFHRLLVPTGGKISTRNFWTPSSLTNAHFRFAYTVSCVNVIFASFPVFFAALIVVCVVHVLIHWIQCLFFILLFFFSSCFVRMSFSS